MPGGVASGCKSNSVATSAVFIVTMHSSPQAKQIHIPAKKWTKKQQPKRILAIRLQAMGDLVITLPYLQSLRNTLPAGTKLDLLTRQEVESIPKNLELFNHVYTIGGGRNWKKQLVLTWLLLPKLLFLQYDVVIDLQNNIISKIVRKALRPMAWSEFDRFSPVPAGECTRLSIEAIGLGKCRPDSSFTIKNSNFDISTFLKENGWDTRNKLILLNPAAAFPTRNWPIERYSKFAQLWMKQFPNTQFVIMGTSFISAKANYLKHELGQALIDLVGKTTPVQAFALLRKFQLVVSEDSGLMHMSWVSGIPTLALFGATRSDRATPLGSHSLLLHSSDLPCGNCMLEQCRYGDNHCMTRYSAQFVFEKAVEFIQSAETKNHATIPPSVQFVEN